MIVKRVAPLSCAKIAATVQAAVGLLFGILTAIVASVVHVVPDSLGFSPAANLPWSLGLLSLVILPIVYGVIGFIAGALGAWIYNAASGFVGGLQIDLEP